MPAHGELEYKPINLGTRSNPYRKGRNRSARLVNCWAEETGGEGRTGVSIHPEAGFTTFGGLIQADAPVRGGLVVGQILVVAVGRNVYRVDTSGTATLLGGLPTDGPVYMARNRRDPAQVGIVSDGLYYVYTIGGAMVRVEDPDLPPPSSFAFLEGYGLLPTGKRFSLTGLDDFTTIGALDFASNEAYPDDTIRVETLNGEAVFFGEESIEFWPNTGGEAFALSKRFAIETGCLSAAGVAKVDTDQDKVLIFVAADHTVRVLSGSQTTVISSPEIAELIKDLAEAGRASELTATAWASGGRYCYALSCADWSRVYSPGKGWVDRKSYGLERWRVAYVFNFAGKRIAGDYATGQLYEMRDDVYVEGSAPLMVEIITPEVHAAPYRVRFDALAVDVLTGVGLNSGSEVDDEPRLMIEMSRDGGETYHGYEERSLGRQAETQKRVRIYRLGVAGVQGYVFRLSVSAAVMKRFDGAYVATTRLAA